VVVVFLGNVLVSKVTFMPQETLRLILGLGCISGHNWTIFLRFKGGKGIATTFVVLWGLSIKIASLKLILGLLILTWILIFVIVRIVSVASVLSGIALPVYTIIFKESNALILLSVLLCIFVILRHKSNLKRVFQGKEPRLTFKRSA
jgi:glycerol-3-phosphate acyltransferase PlsY